MELYGCMYVQVSDEELRLHWVVDFMIHARSIPLEFCLYLAPSLCLNETTLKSRVHGLRIAGLSVVLPVSLMLRGKSTE